MMKASDASGGWSLPYDTPDARRAFRQQKSALTRALNRKDWPKVIALADAFERYYNDRGWPVPDDWARWARAKDDAILALRREAPAWL